MLICAADTFRAAASDQLAIWAERTGVPLIQQKQGTDPAAVLFDSLKASKARGSDVLIVDTAGRLHNKSNLMAELEKMKRVAAGKLKARLTKRCWSSMPSRAKMVLSKRGSF